MLFGELRIQVFLYIIISLTCFRTKEERLKKDKYVKINEPTTKRPVGHTGDVCTVKDMDLSLILFSDTDTANQFLPLYLRDGPTCFQRHAFKYNKYIIKCNKN